MNYMLFGGNNFLLDRNINKENNWFPTSKQIEDKVKNIKNKNILMILNLQIILQDQIVKT